MSSTMVLKLKKANHFISRVGVLVSLLFCIDGGKNLVSDDCIVGILQLCVALVGAVAAAVGIIGIRKEIQKFVLAQFVLNALTSVVVLASVVYKGTGLSNDTIAIFTFVVSSFCTITFQIAATSISAWYWASMKLTVFKANIKMEDVEMDDLPK
eukprot:748932_1